MNEQDGTEVKRRERTRLFGRAGRLQMAWYCLRGHTVIYRAVIRDGGIDLREGPRAIVQEVHVYGADIGLHLPGPEVPLYIAGDVTRDDQPGKAS